VLLKQGLVLFPLSLNQLGKTASLKNKSKGESVAKARLSNPRKFKPQVTGDVSPGLTFLNRKNLPIEVTLGGEGSCYASLIFIPWPMT
jgi:hypothetical protein